MLLAGSRRHLLESHMRFLTWQSLRRRLIPVYAFCRVMSASSIATDCWSTWLPKPACALL